MNRATGQRVLKTDEQRHARLAFWWSTEELDLTLSLAHIELSADTYIG